MTYYVANGSGTPYSTASTWDRVTNVPTMHATTNITLTSSTVSQPFTAPNITNKSTGVIAFLNSKSSSLIITATLQEDINGTGTWVSTSATAVITLANVNSGWIHFRWGTPYTFATTGANRYRIKLVRDTSSASMAADSGGVNFSYYALDDRYAVPGVGDPILVIGYNDATAFTLTMDGTQNCGNDSNSLANVVATNRSLLTTYGTVVAQNATFAFDTNATSQLTCKGTFLVDATAKYTMGSVGSPVPATQSCKLLIDMATTDTNGFFALNNSFVTIQGAPKSSTTLWKTTYISGDGSAASPLVTADPVDWQVGDQIVVSPGTNSATNYNEAEEKFIITKNSSTSYVLSDTSGGVESAFSFIHIATSEILNISRNAVIGGVSTAKRACIHFAGQSNTGQVDIDWLRTENGPNQSALFGFQIGNRVACDYSVCYQAARVGFQFSSNVVQTCTGLIACHVVNAQTSTTGGGLWFNSAKKKTLVDCYSINNAAAGFTLLTAFSNTLIRCKAIACMKSTTSTVGGFEISSSGLINLTDCEAQACRFAGVSLSSATDTDFDGFLAGTKTQNQTVDINLLTTTYNTVTFSNSLFGSATLLANYLLLIDGSEIRFHNFQQTDNNHIWYTNFGSAQSTGAGLSDTTVRTTGSLAARISSEDSTEGFNWTFHIPAKARSIVNFFGYFLLNTTFTNDPLAVVTVSLFRPGSDTADSMATLDNTRNDWQAVVLSAQNPVDIDGLAEIQVNSLTATPGAYVYADDFYNAGNTIVSSDKVTGLDTWFDGKPIDIITPQATSAADIWTFPVDDLTTTGTTGKQISDVLTLAKFLGLK